MQEQLEPILFVLAVGCALLSITDTVSVRLAFRSVRVPHRLAAITEGEESSECCATRGVVAWRERTSKQLLPRRN